MLVLSRRKDECVDIDGGRIQVMVVDVRTDPVSGVPTVRLGFKAPKEVTIHRREISEAIARDGNRKVKDKE